jgi:hypothetical protein
MNRFANFARLVGVATVSMLVVLATHTPAPAPQAARVDSPAWAAASAAPTYLPAQYVDEERAAHAAELPAQF